MTRRELIDTRKDKRYVRRDEQGRFEDSVEVGRSLAADRRSTPRPRPSLAKATRVTTDMVAGGVSCD
jgi:hypothetical protein